MNAPASLDRGLLLEALETRTLLAADDPFGLVADFDLTMQALSGNGEFAASFSKNFGNQQLVLTGSTQGVLTIDLDKLPAFITNIRISSFAEVNFIGTDQVKTLVIEDVDIVKASNLTVLDNLHATDVSSLSVAFAADTTVLKGTKMELNARSVDGYNGLLSYLDQLTLTTDSEVLLFTSGSAEQTLYLTNSPKLIVAYGIQDSSIHFGLPPVIEDPTTNPGTEPPIPGYPPGDPGTDVPHGGGTDTPSTEPNDPVVIITLPADERTRAFVAELRELLRSPSSNPQQFVLEFLQRLNPPAVPVPEVANVAALDDRHTGSSTDLFGETEPGSGDADLTADLQSAHASYDLSIDRQLLASSHADVAVAALPDGVVPVNNVEIDVLGATPFRLVDDDNIPVVTDRPVRENGEELSLQDGLQAFGSYIVERVSAEFFPGEQSLVLLVDPKPTRAPFVGRNSALDKLASGGVEIAHVDRLLA